MTPQHPCANTAHTDHTRGSVRLAKSAAIALVFAGLAACDTVPLGQPGTSTAPTKRMPQNATPTPRGGINLVGNCDQREVDGFEEQARVNVQGSRVRNLTWRMKIGTKGSCQFDGEEFRQTKTTPSIELTAKDGSGCKLLMWSDPRRVTLAHSGCAKYCTPSSVYDKAWPVMFNPATGACAKTN